ncbi:SigE family RNA polymerase sigma factor [Allostreptomyces psammosilenae]|uniref:RNA polymerase sigma-70 factor (Sigma-E family) n=1 Tax=Allostreptomyces psammosilenae TaxID=1892865 RepID=A0A853A4G1_9ACTN|nr:SigE family RNA polymerase sigma factor [Allostreptomyces psammosilenae]NYI05591.1 RNA polymerase sigma-70 factor (sigma-E family) [Allostreptomyces psammosilenae]
MAVDHGEFMEFATARSAHLFRTAYLLCGDWHLAEDLTQTTLATLYRHWKRVRRADNPAAYAQAAVVRAFLSHRRLRRATERPTGTLPDTPQAEPDDAALRVTLLAALRELPAKDRAVVVLRYWDDRSVEETAALLRMRPGAVRTRAMRALARLRVALGDDRELLRELALR